ncbi:MAG: T9SS type A sorting domain-containing protein, partial [Saprospiraceae bacterium]
TTETLAEIFPNPAHAVLNVQLANESNVATKVLLFNYLGALIYTENVDSQHDLLQLDVANLPRGVYQLVIKTENHIQQVERIVLR